MTRVQPPLGTGSRACPLTGQQVSIVNNETSADGSHLIYILKVTWGDAPWHVRKRYSDFEEFHRTLLHFFGKDQVPYLTGKKKLPVGATSQRFAQKRTKKLQSYLRDVIDLMSSWFLVVDVPPQGPGSKVGVRPLLYKFLEFASNAQFEPPTAPAVQVQAPVMASADFDQVMSVLQGVDLADDDERIGKFRGAVEQFRAAGKVVDLDCARASGILDNAFFSDTKLRLCRDVLPLIQDLENIHKVYQVIDFDDDLREVQRLVKIITSKARPSMPRYDSTDPRAAAVPQAAPAEVPQKYQQLAARILADPGGLDAVLRAYTNFADRLEEAWFEDESGDDEVTATWVRERWAPDAAGHEDLRLYLQRIAADEDAAVFVAD